MKTLKFFFLIIYGALFYALLHYCFHFSAFANLSVVFYFVMFLIIGLLIGITYLAAYEKFKERTFYAGLIILSALALMIFSEYGHFVLKSDQNYFNPIVPSNYEDGIAEVYYMNGNIQERAEIKNGKFSGFYEEFDYDGNILTIGKYVNGLKDGTWSLRRFAEAKWRNNYYSMGQKVGKWLNIDNGYKYMLVTYLNNDSIVHTTWNQQGEAMVINGEGIHVENHYNGNPRMILPFKNGKINGTGFLMNENGDTLERVNYIDGKRKIINSQ